MPSFNEVQKKKVEENSLMQIAINIHSLFIYKDRGHFTITELYEKNITEFCRKFKLRFLTVDDAEVENFIRIYLTLQSMYCLNHSDIEICSHAFAMPCLKADSDRNCGWFLENNEDHKNVHLP